MILISNKKHKYCLRKWIYARMILLWEGMENVSSVNIQQKAILTSLKVKLEWKKLQVCDQSLCDIIERVLCEQRPFKNGVLQMCKELEWGYTPWLGWNNKGRLFVYTNQCIFRKPVSQKDRFLYHDSTRIHAPRIVFPFTKTHPGLSGESEVGFYFITRNENKQEIGINNLICMKGVKAPKGRYN